MSLFKELKRRNVFRVGVAYLVAAWLVAQVLELALESFATPDWVMKTILVLLLVGLPFALIFAWAFELTPEGIKRDKDVDRSQSVTHQTGRKLDFAIIAVLAIAVAYFVADKYLLTSGVAESPEVHASIAVLPFVNMSSDADQEFFSDGITEEILNTLAAIEELQVAGRTSSFRFKNKTDIDFATIGEMLGVSTILEGSVRTAGETVRITAQLIVAETGFHLWSETYDRDLTDIFAIQEEIANAIGAALEVELGLKVDESLNRRHTDNSIAYQWYLRGQQHIRMNDVKSHLLAADAFEEAMLLDTDYVPPYIGYAEALLGRMTWGSGSASELLADAKQKLDLAAALDPDYAARYRVLSDWHGFMGDVAGQRSALERALELDPDDPMNQLWWAYFLEYNEGKSDQAIEVYRQYLTHEPLDAARAQEYAFFLANAGRMDEAEAEYLRVLAFDPGNADAMHNLGDLYQYFGNRIADGVRWREKGFSLDPNNPIYPQLAVRAYLDLGVDDFAERWVEIAVQADEHSVHTASARYLLARYRGDDLTAREASVELAKGMRITVGGWSYVPDYLWLRELYEIDPELVFSAFETLAPKLLLENPVVEASTQQGLAISLAAIYQNAGEIDRANDLLEQCLTITLATTQVYAQYPGRIAVHALKGDVPNALKYLRESIDQKHIWDWWMLEQDPVYSSLWDQPEFKAMMDEVRADMAGQLEEVRELH